MTSNISISTLTNKTLNDNSISIRNILNTNYVNLKRKKIQVKCIEKP